MIKTQIKKVLYIDDELEMNEGQTMEMVAQILAKEGSIPEFQDYFREIISDEIIKDICEYQKFAELEDSAKQEKIVEVLKNKKPEYFNQKNPILEGLISYFEGKEVQASPDIVKIDTTDIDLIVIDFKLKNFTAVDVIKELIKGKKPKYVIILSLQDTFSMEGRDYNICKAEEKQAFIRNYMSEKSLQFDALLNHIHKKDAVTVEGLSDQLNRVLLEFEAGKIMIEAMNSIKSLMCHSINEAVGTLLLTNAKTIKALISEKLEKEGASETNYLVDLSLDLVRNFINRDVAATQEVHNKLQKINQWPDKVEDYNTDEQLRKISRLRMYDENVNARFAPIDFGDVFEVQVNNKSVKALLISQSCDLIIRRTGANLERAEKSGLLVVQEKGDSQSHESIRLGDEQITWNVRKTVQLPTCILDYASINSNGEVSLTIGSTIERKATWGEAFTSHMRDLITRHSDYFSKLSDGNSTYWDEDSFGGIKTKKDNNLITWNIKRVGRLDSRYTTKFLRLYTHMRNRVPLSMDPSDVGYQLVERVKINGIKANLTCWYQGRFVYMEIDDLERRMVGHGFCPPEKNIQIKIEDKLKVYSNSSEQLEKTLVPIDNMAVRQELGQMGLVIKETSVSEVTIECHWIAELGINDKKFDSSSFEIKTGGNLQPQVKLKKEFITDCKKAELGVDLGDYLQLTHKCFNTKIKIEGTVMTLDISEELIKLA